LTTVTKIFVVLVCLFAFIFTPMAIQFAARTQDWQQMAIQNLDAAETAQANMRSALSVAASEETYYKSLLEEKENEILEMQRQKEQLNQQINNLVRERDQLSRSRDSLETATELLSGQLEVSREHNQELDQSREQALESERRLRAQNISLSNMVKKLNAQMDILQQKLREQREIAHNYRQENRQLRRQMQVGQAGEPMTTTPTPTAEAAQPTAEAPISGTVTSVQGDLASIDVGSAAGVQPGMRMVILRGEGPNARYVADLEITSDVTPNEAVGRIKLEGDLKVRSGDQVQDVVSFNARD
jgi:septal ring factor EnvC (AmiA/AmiB activator)